MADNDNQHDRSETPQPEGPAPQQGQEHGSARDEARDSSAEQSAATPGDDAAAKPDARSDEQPAERAGSDTDDGTEPADDDEKPQSRGLGIRLRELSGPQACLSIVGCGTLAAVLVVGLVFGGIRLIAGSIFGGDEGDSADVAAEVPDRTPREELEPGVLDVCGVAIESSGVLTNLNRDERGEPNDTTSDGVRTIQDDCSWDLSSRSGARWSLAFSYVAVVETTDSGSLIDVADDHIGHFETDARDDFTNIEVEGDLPNSGIDSADFYFGASAHEGMANQYAVVGRVKSGVFLLRLADLEGETLGGPTSQDEFSSVVADVLPYVKSDFERQLPDS